MRVLALGDTHGRTEWKKIVENEKFDKVIFIGDYFDTHDDVSPEQQKENFKDIINFKRENTDKVVLLFGNHDFHYLKGVTETYSGYQQWQKTDIQELLHSAIDDESLQMCHVHLNFMFSHAGVTKTWCQNNSIPKESIEQSINDLFKFKPNSFRFTSGRNYCPYGDDVEQSPIWVRPNSLLRDRVDGYIQVVGHTTQDNLVITDDVILIDTLGTSGEYFICDDFQLSVGPHI
jgi:predicted phosphodiesterase